MRGAAGTPKAGEPFSPHGLFHAVFVPDAILDHPKLNDAAALLWGRLARYCGKSDNCYPSLDTLAKETGSSVATVGRSLKRLEEEGFIRRQRRGPGRKALCILLWHPCLGSSLRAKADLPDSAKVRNQEPPLIPQKCGVDSAKVRSVDSAKVRSAYKEEKNHSEKNHLREPSSTENSSSLGEQKKQALALDSQTGDGPDPVWEVLPGGWWTQDQLERWAQTLGAYRMGSLTGIPEHTPDAPTMKRILANFTDADDCALWFKDLTQRNRNGRKINSDGFFVNDAATWQTRAPALRQARDEASDRREREQQQEIEERERLAQEEAQKQAEATRRFEAAKRIMVECALKGWERIYHSDCQTCAGYGRNPDTEEFCGCAAGVKAKKTFERCPKCNDIGHALNANLYVRCDCKIGQQWTPELIAALNRQRAKDSVHARARLTRPQSVVEKVVAA